MTTSIQFSTYKAWVLNRLDDTSFDSAKLLQFANDENRDICNQERWPFMIKTISGTITTTAATYDWQSDCQALINLLVVNPDANQLPLHYMPFEVFDQKYPDPSQLTKAPPTIWTGIGTTFTVGPAYPDATYTLIQRYVKEPTVITGDSSVLDVPDAFSEIIVLGMLARTQMTNDQYDLAQVTLQEREIRLDKMREKLLLPPSGEAISNEWGRQRPGYGDPWYPWE